MVPEKGFQNHLQGRVREAYPPSNKTVFEGTATAQAFEWSIAMESTWPVRKHRLQQKWENGTRQQEVARSGVPILWSVARDVSIAPTQSTHWTCAKCICGLSSAGRRHPIGAPPTSNTVRTTECRSALEMHMYGFQVILRNTFAPRDLDTVINLFFLRLPIGQYGPVSQLSQSEERCTGPFNWGEAHCAGEKVKRKIGPFLRKSL